jgi:DNA-binding transcriptional LysR family regulator
MDLNRVAIFVRVVRDGGFTAAARSLGLPKSSVSRAVTLLEADLGVRLLQRSTRTSRPTAAGVDFYERAARGLTELEEAAASAADLQGAVRGHVRITAPTDLGVWLLAPVLSRFAQRHPAVHVDVVLTGRVVDMVEEGFDLAVRAGALRDTNLIARRLDGGELALYATPAHLARFPAPQHPRDLTAHPCVLFRGAQGRATWRFQCPGGTDPVEVVVTGPLAVDDFSFARAAVLDGVGVGLLPDFVAHDAARSGALVRVLPEWRFSASPLHLVYPSARHLPQRVALLRDALVAGLATPR